VLARGFRDPAGDAEPVAHEAHLAERYAGLRHPERAGIHADEHGLDARADVALEVALVRLARVDERVVDVRHRRAERERVDGRGDAAADPDAGARAHTSVAIMKIRSANPSTKPPSTTRRMRSSL
jgi:hypothetical protein